MKPEIEITVDDMGVLTLTSTFAGAFLNAYRISEVEAQALREFFATTD